MKTSQFVVAATSTAAGARGYVPVVLSTHAHAYRATTTMAAGGAAGQWARMPRLPTRKRQLDSSAVATADGGGIPQTAPETPNAQLRIGYRPFKLVEHAALLCMSAAVFYARLRKERLVIFLANAFADAAICTALFALLGRLFMRELLATPRLYEARDVAPDEASRFVKLDVGGGSSGGKSGGVEFHYLDARLAGSPGIERDVRRLVHCSHGFGASSLSYLGVLQGLAERLDATVVAQDNPGFGLTERPRLRYTPAGLSASPYSFPYNALAAAALMRHVRPPTDVQTLAGGGNHGTGDSTAAPAAESETVLVGHSMGALTAIRLCLDLDPKTTRLVLVSPAVVAPANSPSPTSSARPRLNVIQRGCSALSSMSGAPRRWLLAGILRLFGMGLILPLHMLAYSADFWRKGLGAAVFQSSTVDGAFVDRYRWPSLSKRWDRGMANFVTTQFYQGAMGSTTPSAKEAEGTAAGGGEGGEGGAQQSVVSRLASHVSNGLQVLIVHGDRDAVVPLSVSQKLVAALSPPTTSIEDPAGGNGGAVTLLTMGSCGHIPHEEYPEEFVSAVGAFVKK